MNQKYQILLSYSRNFADFPLSRPTSSDSKGSIDLYLSKASVVFASQLVESEELSIGGLIIKFWFSFKIFFCVLWFSRSCCLLTFDLLETLKSLALFLISLWTFSPLFPRIESKTSSMDLELKVYNHNM